METVADVLSYINIALFAGLFVLAGSVWWRERDRPSAWFALTLGTLTVVTVAGLFISEDPQGATEELISKALIGVLLLFPYSLFRFTAQFSKPKPKWDALASLSTFALIVWTLLLPEIPGENDPRPAWFTLYILGVLALWTVLSASAAFKLWRGGKGEPSLARKRMRLLSLGSIGLNLAVLVAGALPADHNPAFDIVTGLFGIAAAVFFYFGFAPPPFLRYVWRRHESEEMQRAIVALMTATDESDVSAALLPHVAAIFGGRTAALVDEKGEVIGAHGMTEELRAEVVAAATEREGSEDQGSYVRVEMPFGAMFVWATPYTPFFGREDLDLLQSIGVMADLALERCRYLEKERDSRIELERINHELADAQALAQLGSWEWVIEEDRVGWSDELYRIFGVPLDDFGASYEAYMQLVHPEDRDQLTMVIDRAYRIGEDYEVEHRITRPSDGKQRWIRSRGRTVSDESGKVLRLLGTAQDVTEVKMAGEYERELREAEVRQKQALELNDNVVQGLAVAGMAMELGESDKAKDAIARTLAAAQSIITGLLRGAGKDREVLPGDLVRTNPAGLEDTGTSRD